MATNNQSTFQDYFPLMAEKLGGDGLIRELCSGFRLLTDVNRDVITFESLKRNAAVLGLQDLNDGDLRSMIGEGDLNGDGVLDEREFCVMMFRMSPGLMEQSQVLLEEAIEHELGHFF